MNKSHILIIIFIILLSICFHDSQAEIIKIPADSLSFYRGKLDCENNIEKFHKVNWLHKNSFCSMLYNKAADNFWIRIRLPKEFGKDDNPSAIYVSSINSKSDLYALNKNSSKIEKRHPVPNKKTQYGMKHYAIYELEPEDDHSDFFLDFSNKNYTILDMNTIEVFIGSADALLEIKNKKLRIDKFFQIAYITAGHFLICSGLIFLLIAWYFRRRKKNKFPFAIFAVLAISEGIVDLLFTFYPEFIGLSNEIKHRILPFFISLLVFCIIFFIKQIFQIRKNIVVNILMSIIGFFIFIAIFFPDFWFAALVPFLLLNNIISFTILYLVGRSYFKSPNRDVKIIFIAALIPAVMIVNATLIHLGFFPAFFELPGLSTIGYFFVFGYLLLESYSKLTKELELNREKVSKLEKENLKSQILALKNQLNPHFLFNTFGTLMSLIEMDKDLAVEYVEELANVYRYVLQTSEKELITLSEEIDFIKSYQFLISKRFRKSLIIELEIDKKYCNFTIPPLSIQLLIENAVKHNTISSSRPLKIEIFIRNDKHLVVKNNYQKKRTLEKSMGIGLDNLKKRYLHYTDEAPQVFCDENIYEVKLPLINKKLKEQNIEASKQKVHSD